MADLFCPGQKTASRAYRDGYEETFRVDHAMDLVRESRPIVPPGRCRSCTYLIPAHVVRCPVCGGER